MLRDRGLVAPSPSGPIGEEVRWASVSVRKCWNNIPMLGDAELRFVDELGRRLQQYGAKTVVSDRQKAFLADVVAKIDKRLEAGQAADPGVQ